jgi:hypothetical protein
MEYRELDPLRVERVEKGAVAELARLGRAPAVRSGKGDDGQVKEAGRDANEECDELQTQSIAVIRLNAAARDVLQSRRVGRERLPSIGQSADYRLGPRSVFGYGNTES